MKTAYLECNHEKRVPKDLRIWVKGIIRCNQCKQNVKIRNVKG